MGFLAGAAAALPASVLYAYATLYLGVLSYFIDFFNLFLTAGFGAFIGTMTAKSLRWAKVRNAKVAAVVGAAAGFAALYLAWGFWVHAWGRGMVVTTDGRPAGLIVLLTHPGGLWRVIRAIHAARSTSDGMGWFLSINLWFRWVVEAVIIVWAAVDFSKDRAMDTPFCESCNHWCKTEEGTRRLKAAEPDELKSRVEAKDFGYLDTLGAAELEARVWTRLDLHHCSRCGRLNALTVQAVAWKEKKFGRKSEHSETIVDKLLVSSWEAGRLRRLSRTAESSPP